MRTLVPVVVYRPYREFLKGERQPLHFQEHVGFVLEPLSAKRRQRRQVIPGECAQPGLGVGYPYSAQQPEHYPGGVVPEAAFRRNIAAGEIPDAEHRPAAFRHFSRAAVNVLRVVLSVVVRGDDSVAVREMLQDVAECGLESAPLAAVDLMAEHRALRHSLKLRENSCALCAAAVVHDDDIPESGGDKSSHYFKYALRRVVGRYYDWHVHFAHFPFSACWQTLPIYVCIIAYSPGFVNTFFVL